MEAGGLLAQRWILAWLRNQTFFSIASRLRMDIEKARNPGASRCRLAAAIKPYQHTLGAYGVTTGVHGGGLRRIR